MPYCICFVVKGTVSNLNLKTLFFPQSNYFLSRILLKIDLCIKDPRIVSILNSFLVGFCQKKELILELPMET